MTCAILLGIGLFSCNSDYEFAYLYRKLPFEMGQVGRPQIPPREISIVDFGGIGDGMALNTEVFAKAIEVLDQNGGGRIVVPMGVWLTGPVALKDRIELHISKDAVLMYAGDGSASETSPAMISASGVKDVAVTGAGIIDGSRMAGNTAVLSFYDCENVLLEDCILQNVQDLAIHPSGCDELIIKDVTVNASSSSRNADGLLVELCEDVLVLNSRFDVSADAVGLRSVKNLIIENCNVLHCKGGLVLDKSVNGGVQNVAVEGCRFLAADYGIRFVCGRGSGAAVENLYVKDVVMADITAEPLSFDMYDKPKSAVDIDYVPADASTPMMKGIHISNLICGGAARAMYFGGIPEMNIENVVIKDCKIVSAKGADLRYSSGVVIRNMELNQSDSLGYTLSNCKNVVMQGCTDATGGAIPAVRQYNSENVTLD